MYLHALNQPYQETEAFWQIFTERHVIYVSWLYLVKDAVSGLLSVKQVFYKCNIPLALGYSPEWEILWLYLWVGFSRYSK